MTLIDSMEAIQMTEQQASEQVASDLVDNLHSYVKGDRDDFVAHFPLGLDGVQTEAHRLFLERTDAQILGDDHILVMGGVKLHVNRLVRDDTNNGEPFHVSYGAHKLPPIRVSC